MLVEKLDSLINNGKRTIVMHPTTFKVLLKELKLDDMDDEGVFDLMYKDMRVFRSLDIAINQFRIF